MSVSDVFVIVLAIVIDEAAQEGRGHEAGRIELLSSGNYSQRG